LITKQRTFQTQYKFAIKHIVGSPLVSESSYFLMRFCYVKVSEISLRSAGQINLDQFLNTKRWRMLIVRGFVHLLIERDVKCWPRTAMSNPQPSRRFCAPQFRFQL